MDEQAEDRKPIAIIAVDPGKMSGVAEWTADGGFIPMELSTTAFFDYIHARVHELHQAGYDIHLVAESFIITIQTAKNTQAGWSLELIGVLKFIIHRYGLRALKLQQPSVGKTFGTNGKLKYLGWYRGSSGGFAGHADDATRHLVTYAASRGLVFTIEQLTSMADV